MLQSADDIQPDPAEASPGMKERLRAALQARSSNRLLRFGYKFWQLKNHSAAARANPRESLRFILRSPEVSNFTYDNGNVGDLVTAVASSLGVETGQVQSTIDELVADDELRDGLRDKLKANPLRANEPRYGYRMISYAIVRLRKPGVIFEAGTHDGLAASLMLRALELNAAEGDEGKLISFDRTADAGWLIPDRLRGDRLNLIIDDVDVRLEPELAIHGVDYFIEDFGNGYPGKGWMVESALAHTRSDELVFLTECDNNPTLSDIASAAGGSYAQFDEQPINHWWAGHNWGISVLPKG